MNDFSRRGFLGASIASLAAISLFGQDKPSVRPIKTRDDPAFQPSTLFLTWQRDPTTTMTVQWVGTAGETADNAVYYTTDLDWHVAITSRRARQAVPHDGLQSLSRRIDRPDPGDRLPVPHRQALADLSLPHHAGQGHRHHSLHLRRRLRRERAHGRQQHPGGPAGSDVRDRRRRPRLRQRPVGGSEPRIPAQLQQAHAAARTAG